LLAHHQNLITHQLVVARVSSKFDHAPACYCSRVIKIRSRTSLLLLVRHRNLITREQNLIMRQLVVARASSNFDHRKVNRSPV